MENYLTHSIKNLLKHNSVSEIAEVVAEYMSEDLKGMDAVSNPDAVIKYARLKICPEPREYFLIFYVNVRNEIIDTEVIAEGTIDQAIIYPRRIVEKILYFDSAGMIIMHNHPSGHCTPSEPDRIITSKLKTLLKSIDVKLLDHIIVSKTDYYSFQEEGTL